MSQLKFSDFFTKLRNDVDFRTRFAADPAATLKAEGFDPASLSLPSNIDLDALSKKLDSLFTGKEGYTTPTQDQVSRLSADELWAKFNIIKGATATALRDEVSPIVVAVVAYGTAVAVGPVIGSSSE